MTEKNDKSPLLPRLTSSRIAFVHDVVMAALSFFIALALRMGDDLLLVLNDNLLLAGLLFTAVCACVFLFTGLYRGVWRYASLNDVISIMRAVTLALLVFLLVTFMLTRLESLPRSMLLINWFVLAFLLSAPRMLYRVYKDQGFKHLLERNSHARVPVLLIGAGDAAEAYIREIARDRSAAYEVLGILDERGTRVGRNIRGVAVLGLVEEVAAIAGELGKRGRPPQRLILTKPLERERMQALVALADSQGMSLARMPRLTELQLGTADVTKLRPIAIEDLLGRTQTKLDRGAMRRLIEGRGVVVTGAGGSIGSELARQIAAFEPSALTLVDNSEFQLYTIDLEIFERFPALPRRAILADVRDRPLMQSVIGEAKPDLVFHAAALKHVPMAELNPVEAVLTNVVGSRNVADACRRAGVAAMVQVSTDKAINPTSVMGATKRLAECYCQALDIDERARGRREGGPLTHFVTVRFGNVLGSTGSVVPLFRRQLERGGPLTVTHPEMKRYFMTIRESVELVLQATDLGIASSEADSGKIYVLNMGEPVKIDDLARQMIRLSGQEPGRDVEIVYSGLRPGEKLFEELFHDGEPLIETNHPGLRLAAPRTINLTLLSRALDELAELAARRDSDEMMALLRRQVPEYRPQPSPRPADAVVVS